ncbi:MAG TPA: class I SAM-dependent methyltransferase [Candidatus Dormibacteraeota bacterium]|nr:class I SAM-dependent methyltransferase [Candidatus Dormibacteraeota bacterium]
MAEELSSTQKEYLQIQLRYDHRDDLPPPNTLAVHQIQHELIVRTVQRYAAEQEVHMLDVGCGWGDFSNQLDSYLKTYVGIEPSPIELGRFTARPNRFLVRGVGEYMDFLRDQSRNFVLLNSVLDHCYDWKRTFANCLRVLAPGGLLIISMENSQKLIARLRRALGREQVHQGHLEFFGLDDTKAFLGRDFEVLESRTIGFLFGLHTVTQRVPLPVAPLRFLNRVANGAFRVIAPNGGHIFFISALRRGMPATSGQFATPFRCPRCQTELGFGRTPCPACGLKLPYAGAGYLDGVELNAPLKDAMGLPSPSGGV